MANFKLNSVTVASESGGTVTVDSAVAGIPAAGVTGVLPVGVTGGSGLNAVPAAGVTGTLPNAVQDNITRLGTVAAGSIAGGSITSATTFPAGHVIQVVSNNSWVAQTFLDTTDDIITVTIDNVLASSYCMIYGFMTLHYNEPSGGTAGFNMFLTRGNTNLVTESSSAGGNVDCIAFTYLQGAGQTHLYNPMGGSIMDRSPATGSNTYKIRGKRYGGAVRIAHDGETTISVMEVAQ